MHEQKVEFSRQIEIKRFVPKKEGKLYARFIDSEYDGMDLNLNYRMINENYALAWVLRD
jgi:hypothetical protein